MKINSSSFMSEIHLLQIEHLVERQKTGETLNEEERVKVALKTTLINQLAKLEARAAAEQ